MNKGKQDIHRLLQLSLTDGELKAEGDFAILRDVGEGLVARKSDSLPSALVLGLKTSESVSSLDKTLGLLTCNRYGYTPHPTPSPSIPLSFSAPCITFKSCDGVTILVVCSARIAISAL